MLKVLYFRQELLLRDKQSKINKFQRADFKKQPQQFWFEESKECSLCVKRFTLFSALFQGVIGFVRKKIYKVYQSCTCSKYA